MRPKSLILLVLALGCGLVASIGISEIINNKGSDGVSTESEAILVAKLDIERSGVLSVDNLKLEEWPKDKIPQGAVRDLADVEGQRPVIRITSGLPILQSMLASGEGATRASGEIPKGYRVVSIRVDEAMGANLLFPGDRVDLQVLARRNPGLGIEKTGAWTFLQDVSVFAVNAETRTDPENNQPIQAKTVALLVTPSQAAKVSLATDMGKIRLIMRGANDDEGENTVVSIRDVIGGSEKFEEDKPQQTAQTSAAAPDSSSMLEWLKQQQAAGGVTAAAGAGWQMVVMRGSDVTVEEFQEGSLLPTTLGAGGASTDLIDLPPSDVPDLQDDTQEADSKDGAVDDTGDDENQDS